MNDLSYKEWMRFQKSFFRFSSMQDTLDETIRFFTKSKYGVLPSKCLLAGFPEFDAEPLRSVRVIDRIPALRSADAIAHALRDTAARSQDYDFVAVDLRDALSTRSSLDDFLTQCSEMFFASLRQLLKSERYCVVFVKTIGVGGGALPAPWAVAQACRGHLRLRDERVGLSESAGPLLYCLVMQGADDARPPHLTTSNTLEVASFKGTIPAYLIPRPPPRVREELLHPAKFPETLVSSFIDIFTVPGARVLDPMAGTGSAIVAAMQSGRDAVGVELSPQFVAISNRRIQRLQGPTLFPEISTLGEGVVLQGDATKLDEVGFPNGLPFDYAVTSPPYWSMLSNPGSEGQDGRRSRNLPLVYSSSEQDLGNVEDYDQFLGLLVDVYQQVATLMRANSVLTIVVKNVKRKHIVYPLAWDLASRLCHADAPYQFLGTTLWCQDDVGVKPFAVGIHWVSNTLHHYCLHLKRRPDIPLDARSQSDAHTGGRL